MLKNTYILFYIFYVTAYYSFSFVISYIKYSKEIKKLIKELSNISFYVTVGYIPSYCKLKYCL